MKLLYWYQNFMHNRYGVDALSHFLWKVVLILLIFQIFLSWIPLTFVIFVLLFVMNYRIYSKKIEKRREENNRYLIWKRKVLSFFPKRDKNYIYKRCKSCKTILRLPLPNKRGLRHTTCPNCHTRLRVWCFKKQTIEVIRKGVKKKL